MQMYRYTLIYIYQTTDNEDVINILSRTRYLWEHHRMTTFYLRPLMDQESKATDHFPNIFSA
jgi:hypothetical protein